MVDWVIGIIETVGYPGIVFLMFLENVFPPIPSEIVMPFAGFVAARGQLWFWGIVAAGTLGSVLGALPLYYLGKAIGQDRLKRWARDHGQWFALSESDLDKAHDLFDKHGVAIVFFARLMPGVRSLISIPAGTEEMHLGVFLLYTAAGASLWTALLAHLGRILNQNYRLVEAYLDPVAYAVLGVLAALYLWRLVQRRRETRNESRLEEAEPRTGGRLGV